MAQRVLIDWKVKNLLPKKVLIEGRGASGALIFSIKSRGVTDEGGQFGLYDCRSGEMLRAYRSIPNAAARAESEATEKDE